MRESLSPEEIASYRENGFVAIPDLLSADELATWRTTVDKAVADRAGQRFATGSRNSMTDEDREYEDNIFTQRVNLWQTDDDAKALMFDEHLGRLIADLAGVDAVRIWHDQALIKKPFQNYTSYHLDNPYWSFTSRQSISVWVPLDDATVENGCLYYVPGSHRGTDERNVIIGPELGAIFEVYPDWRSVPAVPCPIPAGGACFHNGYTIHGAGANMTPGQRRAMTCAYMPDGSTFNGQASVLPASYLETLQVGDVIDNDDHVPLIFSRA